MEKKLEHYLKISYLELFLGGILVIITVIGVLLFWNASKNAEQVLAERAKLREFVLARAGAMAVGDFLETRKMKLLILADLQEIKSIDLVKGRVTTQKFVQEMEDRPITSLGVVNKSGKIVWSVNPQQENVASGTDLSDREYFLWAKNQTQGGGIYISEPVIARTGPAKGTWIIVIATPLFHNNQFNGALYAVITAKDLMENYVTPLTVSSNSSQTLLTKDGVIVASTIPESTGTNFYPDNPSLINNLGKGQAGSMVADLVYSKNKPIKSIIGYASIKIDEKPWFLLVSIPYKEIKDQLNPFLAIQNQGLALLFIGLIVIILLGPNFHFLQYFNYRF